MTNLEIFSFTHAEYIFAAFGAALCFLSVLFWRSFRLARASKNKLSKYLKQDGYIPNGVRFVDSATTGEPPQLSKTHNSKHVGSNK